MKKQPTPPPPASTESEDEIGPHKTDLNLYQRIHAIMADIRRLQKDKAVGSGNYAYKAVSEEKVVTEVRAAMLRHGVVIFPIEQEHILVDHVRPNQNGSNTMVSLSTVNVRYKLANVDKMDEFEIVASSGTGVDSQDKGVGKAMTYSMKYALLRTFMIPTGADPDDVHNDDLEKAQSERPVMAVAPPEQQAQPVQYATAAQKEEIIHLLNHPLITLPEKQKMLLNINRLDEERAEQAIKKLNKAIEDREGTSAVAS